MTADGLLVESTGGANWAWVAIHLAPAPTLAESGAYADVAEPQRRAEALAAERAWLAAQWSTAQGARYELRYTNDIARKSVSCTLLGRVHGPDPAAVTAAAVSLRDRLAMTPRHVRAEPISDPAEVRRRLVPTRIDPHGCFELRKRLKWSWCTRRDTTRTVCFEVSPLVTANGSWELMWLQLAELPSPTTVAVYLEPYEPPTELIRRIQLLAREYAQLAAAGPINPVWSTAAPPDPFAVLAAPGYGTAVRRYAGRAYRIRISVAADGPIDPSSAELLAATVGGAVVRRPAPGELAAAWRNLAALNRDWLDETYRQGAPAGALSEVERILCDLADESEASAAFRFPYEIPGHLPLFTAPGRPRPPATPSVRPAHRDPGAPEFGR